MEEKMKVFLPICGQIQHGIQKQMENNRKKVVDLGYFIAKVRDNNMQFLVNRFNEKFKEQKSLVIQFFDENPLTLKRVRYNQSGAVCYCLKGNAKGKIKEKNLWKDMECSEDCPYRQIAKGSSKPTCNAEGTLKFLLPEISKDRIWLMKITGQQSISNLYNYFSFQKSLGNSLKGRYNLFLSKVEQTNVEGKKFINNVLDIVKIEDGTIYETSSENIEDRNKISIDIGKNVENTAIKTGEMTIKEPNTYIENDTKINKEKKKTTKTNSEVKSKVNTNNNDNENKQEKIENKSKTNVKQEVNNNEKENEEEDYTNYYCLEHTYNKNIDTKNGKKEYTFGKFYNMADKEFNIVVKPEDAEELKECDLGTIVKLKTKEMSGLIFAMELKYIDKHIKNVVA